MIVEFPFCSGFARTLYFLRLARNILITALFFSVNAFAQNKDAADMAGAFLQMGVGARPAGMGEAFCAVADDADTIYYNPAGLTQIKNRQLSFTHNEWVADIKQDSLVYSRGLARGVLGAGFNYINAGSFERRDEYGRLLSGQFTAYDLVCSLAYALIFSQRLSLGSSLKLIKEKIDEDSTLIFASDIGSLYRISERLKAALVIQNLGQEIKGFSLALNLKAGLAYKPSDRLLLACDIKAPKDSKPSMSLGGEYLYSPLTFRCGYKYKSGGDDIEGLTGLSFGIGFRLEDMRLDYAWAPQGDIGNIHRASTVYSWEKKKVHKPQGKPPVKEKPVVVEPKVTIEPEPKVEVPQVLAPGLYIFAQPSLISPDGDGEYDTITFHLRNVGGYYVNSWELAITSSDGKPVQTFAGKNRMPFTQDWDGRDSEGNIVSDGTYFYTLEVTDKAEKKLSTLPQKITVASVPQLVVRKGVEKVKSVPQLVISESVEKVVITLFEKLLFDSGKADIKEDGYKTLQRVANIIRERKNRVEILIRIEGHTDDVPIGKHLKDIYPDNMALSQKRAESVKMDLAGEDILAELLETVGYGEKRPIAPNDTEWGRQQNRRVEITIILE